MVTRTSPCELQPLHQAIAGELAEPQATRLSQHLQGCVHCRNELERLAGADQWWNDAKAFLGSDLNAEEPARTQAATTIAEEELDEAVEVPLDFLAPSLTPGSLGKLGDYEIDSIIGRGGMGIVLRGHDPALNRHVAIKVLARPVAASAAARRRFTREAQAAAAVVHEHVIPIHSVGMADHVPFLVMQLVIGGSLQERIDAQGPLSVQEVLRIAMQTARGLAAAHAQGLVHRDIKPANILLEKGVDRVCITDFGLARAVDDASQTQSGFIAGTPQYMAPEQARGEPIDARADLFSLGSVMYAMCTGHPPFRAETTLAVLRRICDDAPRDVRQSNPDVPPWLAEIIHRLLAKRPEDRFASATELAELLERWLAHWQQPASIAPPRQATKTKRRRHRHFPIALACLVIATGVAIWWNYWPGLPPAHEFAETIDVSQAMITAEAAPRPSGRRAPRSRPSRSNQQVPSTAPSARASSHSVSVAPPVEFGNEFDQQVVQIQAELARLESPSLPQPQPSNTSLQQSFTEVEMLLHSLEESLPAPQRPTP